MAEPKGSSKGVKGDTSPAASTSDTTSGTPPASTGAAGTPSEGAGAGTAAVSERDVAVTVTVPGTDGAPTAAPVSEHKGDEDGEPHGEPDVTSDTSGAPAAGAGTESMVGPDGEIKIPLADVDAEATSELFKKSETVAKAAEDFEEAGLKKYTLEALLNPPEGETTGLPAFNAVVARADLDPALFKLHPAPPDSSEAAAEALQQFFQPVVQFLDNGEFEVATSSASYKSGSTAFESVRGPSRVERRTAIRLTESEDGELVHVSHADAARVSLTALSDVSLDELKASVGTDTGGTVCELHYAGKFVFNRTHCGSAVEVRRAIVADAVDDPDDMTPTAKALASTAYEACWKAERAYDSKPSAFEGTAAFPRVLTMRVRVSVVNNFKLKADGAADDSTVDTAPKDLGGVVTVRAFFPSMQSSTPTAVTFQWDVRTITPAQATIVDAMLDAIQYTIGDVAMFEDGKPTKQEGWPWSKTPKSDYTSQEGPFVALTNCAIVDDNGIKYIDNRPKKWNPTQPYRFVKYYARKQSGDFKFKDDASGYFLEVKEDGDAFEPADWEAGLKAAIANGKDRATEAADRFDKPDLVLVLHGWNTGPGAAHNYGKFLFHFVDLQHRTVKRTRGAVVVPVIWPSNGGYFSYSAVRTAVDTHAPEFAVMLSRFHGPRGKALIKSWSASAHSMGNHVLTVALECGRGDLKIEKYAACAADIGQKLFTADAHSQDHLAIRGRFVAKSVSDSTGHILVVYNGSLLGDWACGFSQLMNQMWSLGRHGLDYTNGKAPDGCYQRIKDLAPNTMPPGPENRLRDFACPTPGGAGHSIMLFHPAMRPVIDLLSR